MKAKLFRRLFVTALFAAALLFSSCGGNGSVSGQPPDVGTAVVSPDEEVPLAPKPNETKTPEKEELSGDFTIYFIDVGQADSALVECDGKYMLIDGGGKDSSQRLYSFLKKRDIKFLDYVIGTHAHEDHIGGIPGALSFAGAGKVYCSVEEYDTKAFNDFLKAVDGKKLKPIKPKAGDTFELGDAEVKILGPVNFKTDDQNDLSIVLKITYGDTSFLFMADAGRNTEQDILNKEYDIKCDVLKVGHHGSEYSTTYPFLNDVLPKYAVISVGKNNDYGHPTDAVLSKLRDADVTVYRTDLNGDIICTSDGKTVSFELTKGDAFVYDGEGSKSPQNTGTTSGSSGGTQYVGSVNSDKFHTLNCSSGKQILEKNRVFFSSREEALNSKYVPCKKCNP